MSSRGQLVVSKGVGIKKGSYKRYVTKKQMYKAIHNNIENKLTYGTMTTHFSSISNTWAEQALTIVSQGTSLNQRAGNKIRIKSVEIKGVLAQGSNESLLDDPWNVVRCVIGLWNCDNITPLSTGSWPMERILRNSFCPKGLIKKYMDKYIPLQVTSTEKGGGDGYTPCVRTFKYFKAFKKGLLINFGDNSTNYPDRKIIVSMISDSGALVNPGFVTGYFGVTYEDS